MILIVPREEIRDSKVGGCDSSIKTMWFIYHSHRMQSARIAEKQRKVK